MLLKLVENGTINSIDDPISKYDPQFNVTNPFNSEHITFRYDSYTAHFALFQDFLDLAQKT